MVQMNVPFSLTQEYILVTTFCLQHSASEAAPQGKKKSWAQFRDKCPMLFFWPNCEVCGISVPQPGYNPLPLQWKHGVLTTGPPGESPILGSYSVFPFVLGISIRDFLMRLLILCDLRQVALLSLHLFLRCHDGEDTTTSREISLSFHEIFNLSFPMSTPSFIQSLPCSKGWRWKATDSFEDLWETDKRGACAEAQGSERNRNLEIDKELRGTGGQVVLGSHWAEGHCIPWNFDSILWALRWQERALCRRQRWPEWLWKDRFPTLWRWARPEAGSQPLGDLPASEL